MKEDIYTEDTPTTGKKGTILVGENLRELKEHGDLGYPVGVYEIDLKNMHMEHVRWHWHDEIEMIFVTEGRGEFYASEESYLLEKGQGLFINQGILHSVQLTSNHEDCIYTSIVFHPTLFFAYGQTRLCSTYLQPVINNSSLSSLPLTNENDFQKSILELLEQIVLINKENRYCCELYTKEYLIRIWILLLTRRTNMVEPLTDLKSTQVSLDETRAKEAIRYIEEHYTETITLDDIAASIHVSKSECCRCIRRSMKMTPFEYLMKYRIYIAAGMLCDNNNHDSIATLASHVGFNSSSYFNKLFRKYMKCTPSQYKAKQLSIKNMPQ
jgi:AraC-like DNA-binding protein/mannose-6-phosphate isomerase-like protein (cupin superfamily)